MTFLKGLDVSSCQGVIDWAKVPAEYRYVFVKASEGELGRDPTRLRNLAGVRATGRHAFVYHFLRTSQDPEKQAENLWIAVGDTMPGLVMLDFETIADGLLPSEAVAKALACARAI